MRFTFASASTPTSRATVVALAAAALTLSLGGTAHAAGPDGGPGWGGYPQDTPVKSELWLMPGWGGKLRFVDNDRNVDVGQLDKPRAEERRVALPPGRYRVVVSDEANHPFAFADLELGPGSRVRVFGSMLRGLALPPPPPSAAQRAAAAARAVAPADRYPRGLAARPLTLSSRLSELVLGYDARFTADTYENGNSSSLLPVTLGIRWAITDRLEMRDLGIYGVPVLRNGNVPAIGFGAGLSNFGFDSGGKVVLVLTGWLDVKEHFTDRLALQASLQYDATVYTAYSLADHHVIPSLTLLFDAASVFSLIGGLRYDWTQITDSPVTLSDLIAERVDLFGGFHVSPASWMDFRATVGPSWARLDGGNWSTSGRWFGELRFRF